MIKEPSSRTAVSYWYMNVKAAGSANRTTPGEDADGWEIMSSVFKYYIAEAYFGNYAHFGSFIINGDWMISQYGKQYDEQGNYTENSAYTFFDKNHPGDWDGSGNNFVPNFAVDGKTGKVYMQEAYVQGTINASMIYSKGRFISQTPYTINPASNPSNLYYTVEHNYTINLPSARIYNGLILRFLAICEPQTGDYAIKLHSDEGFVFRLKNATGAFSKQTGTDAYINNYVITSVIACGNRWYPLEGEMSVNRTYFFD